ncbi:hypothetical protein A2U01_0065462, partial [Trifolium medium]|nr:hypothetical protein [Trifolium medium]
NNLSNMWLWRTAHSESFSVKEADMTLINSEEEVVT